ncbi:hypothetical protein SDC9_176307 [bioreactor metagenome]|uniref:Uncharacterized protein n=1 Tax=bioreactor metagenome TaxID=1076179 RepID=A0A645GSD9_9ZZZZ
MKLDINTKIAYITRNVITKLMDLIKIILILSIKTVKLSVPTTSLVLIILLKTFLSSAGIFTDSSNVSISFTDSLSSRKS